MHFGPKMKALRLRLTQVVALNSDISTLKASVSTKKASMFKLTSNEHEDSD